MGKLTVHQNPTHWTFDCERDDVGNVIGALLSGEATYEFPAGAKRQVGVAELDPSRGAVFMWIPT